MNFTKEQFFISSITTQQFNNHTSSSMTKHYIIKRKPYVAMGKIATNRLDFFNMNVWH